jgi:ribosomal protein L16 Arg81 hydroxylase
VFDLKNLCDESFFNNYWNKDFFIWKNVLNNPLFDYKTLNQVLNSTELTVEDLRLIDKNQFFNMQGLVRKVGVNTNFKLNKYDVIDNVKLNNILMLNQYSVRFYDLARFLPSLRKFCQNLEKISFRRCDTVAIYSPMNSTCFDWHEDDFAGFAIQLEGSKIWQICRLGENEGDNNYREVTLEKGDLIYFPEGIRHNVLTKEKESLHISFGLRDLEMNEMTRTLIESYECNLFDKRFKYDTDSFALNVNESKKILKEGVMQLNTLFSKYTFISEATSLMLRGIEKGSDFIQLPYSNSSADFGGFADKSYRFLNIQEIDFISKSECKTYLVLRGRCLSVDLSVQVATAVVNNDIFCYDDLISIFNVNVNDIQDLIVIGFIGVVDDI